MSEELCVDFSSSVSQNASDYGRSKVCSHRAGENDQEYKKFEETSSKWETVKVGYKRDLNTAYFVMEAECLYQPDYQLKMIAENNIPGLLKVKGKGINGKSRYEYEIQGKHSLEFLVNKEPLTYEIMISLITDLWKTIETMRDYLLSPNQLFLDPRSIFMENGAYSFCYYPPNRKGVTEGFHELAEFFVREVDYQDRSGIYVAYALHKMTLYENYRIRQVIEEILDRCEETYEEEQEEAQENDEWKAEEYEYGEKEEKEEVYEDWGLEDKTLAERIGEKIHTFLFGWKQNI